MNETAWAGAAYNLVLYMLASHFGIYADAVTFNVTSSPFLQKYFYCFWWGLKNLSCLGQNLSTSTYVGENSFAIIIAIVGLVLFGLLIGNMQVPLFDQMDDRMLDAICERLKPALYTHGTYLVHELDPVNEMLFIIRGYLDSYTTNGGRTGFFNCCRIGPGEFCGEELLTWALDPRPAAFLPSSTRTVQAVSEVEAFALVADDLKFVASQFRRLHSKQLRHTFRFYSHQWRTWAACFIQAAWRRHKRRMPSIELDLDLDEAPGHELMESRRAPDPGAAVFVKRLVASTRREGGEASLVPDCGLKKPSEPDFSMEEES
ncbi:putative Cyclic nucleotide-gated ion channel [Cocos nucifera]|uniref:Putative Cyclic nucleotide-gated ion channel n=1 Tax=Cocos nucifera TaxID=13894 RepID=A0A8K0IED2_COCNU|nr:putative Cyclic nucleotide-gated ion channel [Cocos nucifera]